MFILEFASEHRNYVFLVGPDKQVHIRTVTVLESLVLNTETRLGIFEISVTVYGFHAFKMRSPEHCDYHMCFFPVHLALPGLVPVGPLLLGGKRVTSVPFILRPCFRVHRFPSPPASRLRTFLLGHYDHIAFFQNNKALTFENQVLFLLNVWG